MQSAQVEGEAGGLFVQIGETRFCELKRGGDFRGGSYNLSRIAIGIASVLKWSGHKNGHNRRFFVISWMLETALSC